MLALSLRVPTMEIGEPNLPKHLIIFGRLFVLWIQSHILFSTSDWFIDTLFVKLFCLMINLIVVLSIGQTYFNLNIILFHSRMSSSFHASEWFVIFANNSQYLSLWICIVSRVTGDTHLIDRMNVLTEKYLEFLTISTATASEHAAHINESSTCSMI